MSSSTVAVDALSASVGAVDLSASTASSSSPPVVVRCGLIGDAATATLDDMDWRILRWQHMLKSDLAVAPSQTKFRVFSMLTYVPKMVASNSGDAGDQPLSDVHPYDVHNYISGTDEQLAYLTGTNSECCFIGSSICSERSAVLQLRMKRYRSIRKLYITADGDSIITPGLLCREMLSEFLSADTPIILACKRESAANGFEVQVVTLRDLYPYPSIYLGVQGADLLNYAAKFDCTSDGFGDVYGVSHPSWSSLYATVIATTKKDLRPDLHPLRYAAGVIFSDGTQRTVAMTKLLEYGWSLDPIVKLIPYIEEAAQNDVKPVLIIQSDQFGNLHSPSAPARSHLAEYGYTPVLIFHNREGKLVQTSPSALAPDVPNAIEEVLAAIRATPAK